MLLSPRPSFISIYQAHFVWGLWQDAPQITYWRGCDFIVLQVAVDSAIDALGAVKAASVPSLLQLLEFSGDYASMRRYAEAIAVTPAARLSALPNVTAVVNFFKVKLLQSDVPEEVNRSLLNALANVRSVLACRCCRLCAHCTALATLNAPRPPGDEDWRRAHSAAKAQLLPHSVTD